MATEYDSYEPLSLNYPPIDLQAFAQASDSVDVSNSLSLQSPPDPLFPLNISQTTKRPYVPRFLGPDSIEDIFGPQLPNSSAMVSPSLGSTTMISPQTFTSLDQYVSTLDLQGGQAHPFGIGSSANGTGTLPWHNATVDVGNQPFVPLSPYIMQIRPPSGSPHVSPETLESLTTNFDFAGQNDKAQEM
ncbi:hypothetical protein N7486_001816 [Penicillium sp. IBT 16267x]|nr:hypothetical protein N7486_001816 [Penicillium sp. IBT 16267x]